MLKPWKGNSSALSIATVYENEKGNKMESVILYRTHGGNVDFIREASGDNSEICVFRNIEAAIEYAGHNALLQAVPYQIVELDEL